MSFTLLGAFGAGLLTFVSPCVLPMAPILIASLLSVRDAKRLDRLKVTLWFSAGFSAVFVLLGLGLPWLTRAIGDWKPLLIGFGGAALALFGARMMGWFGEGRLAAALSRTFTVPQFAQRLPKGLQGLGFGALFGLTWTPCVGPVLGGVLTYVASQELSSRDGALLLGSFSLGVTLPFVGLAVASEWMNPVLSRLKKHLPRIEHAAGLGLFIFGAYVISQARLQDFVSPPRSSAGIAAVTSGQEPIRLDQIRSGASRMVFFYSETCPVCHAMERYLPKFEKSCSSVRFDFVRVNVDRSENQRAADHFGVKAVPTVVVLNDRGAELIHLVGYQTESRLRDAATTVTRLACADAEPVPAALEELEKKLSPGSTCGVGASC